MSVYRTLRSVVRVTHPELDPVERRLARAASVADLRRIPRRRLPGGVFDYIDGGAEDERTLAANEQAFAATTFRPRVLRGIGEVDRRDRGLVKEMILRAASARFEALVLTVDTAVFGRRERDVRRGFSLPPTIGPGTFVDGALHPRWTWAFVRSEPIRFANVAGRDVGDGASPVNLSDYINAQFDPSLSWHDVEWLRSIWDGPIVVKGIQTVDDAVIACDAGVDAIALSNHGGRQLDGAPATFSLVAPVADAVGGRLEIICDGGVRRGSNIVKAVAAGATACMTGRAYLYALGAAGERGVDRVLSWFGDDVRRTMTLLGSPDIQSLDRALLDLTPSALEGSRQ
jgi:L-lactate dehydrogenase (cytochrome)